MYNLNVMTSEILLIRNLKSRALLLKSALERSKYRKKEVMVERSSQFPTVNDISNYTPPTNENENDDMNELLELASASTNIKSCSSVVPDNVSKMLKLSKLAELIEEGSLVL
jgi:hypothetical protein